MAKPIDREALSGLMLPNCENVVILPALYRKALSIVWSISKSKYQRVHGRASLGAENHALTKHLRDEQIQYHSQSIESLAPAANVFAGPGRTLLCSMLTNHSVERPQSKTSFRIKLLFNLLNLLNEIYGINIYIYIYISRHIHSITRWKVINNQNHFAIWKLTLYLPQGYLDLKGAKYSKPL